MTDQPTDTAVDDSDRAGAGPTADSVASDCGRPGGDGPQRPDGGRGQTTLDFTIGISVFLLVLIAVFLFVPGAIEPFTQGGQDRIVTANRVGDQLSEGSLGDPSSPHVLNTTCTIEFFEDNAPAGCRYEGTTLESRLGVQERTFVNVTLEGNLSDDGPYGDRELLCWSTGGALIERSDGTCGTTFAIGDTPPERSGTSVTARRVVSINESAGSDHRTDAALIVEVW